MRATREYLLVLAGLVLAAAGCVVLAGTTWATAEATDVLGTEQVRIAGTELVPIAGAVGWLGMAAVVGIHAARGIGRTLVGVLLAAAGFAVAGWASWRAANMDTAAGAAAMGDTVPTLVSTTPAAAIGTATCGAVVAAVGVLTVARGSRWPSMGRKYERPGRPGAKGTNTARDAGRSAARNAWDALDRGDDPTTWLRDAEQTRQNETDTTNGSGRRTRP